MKYCSVCSRPVQLEIPPGDNRPRYVCNHCNTVHYQNPCIIAGCLPTYDKQILLCKRAIEPRYGYWTLPAGFMENGETLIQAAQRETLEEANARVDIGELYTTISVPHINQVHMFFLATLTDLDFYAGDESLAVELFNHKQIPWEELAFPTVRETLRRFLEDQGNLAYPSHVFDIPPSQRIKNEPNQGPK